MITPIGRQADGESMSERKQEPVGKKRKKRYAKPKIRKLGTISPVVHAQTYY
jgi:hypothetical protein